MSGREKGDTFRSPALTTSRFHESLRRVTHHSSRLFGPRPQADDHYADEHQYRSRDLQRCHHFLQSQPAESDRGHRPERADDGDGVGADGAYALREPRGAYTTVFGTEIGLRENPSPRHCVTGYARSVDLAWSDPREGPLS